MTHFRAVGRRVALGRGAQRRVVPALIEVRDGIITRAEPLDEAGYAKEAANAEDLGEALVTPAFIDAHTHLALGFLRGVGAADAHEGNLVEDLFYRYETRLTEEDAFAFAEVAAYESLASGVGLVWDHYYYPEAVAAACRQAGLTCVMAPTLQDVAGPGADKSAEYLAATGRLDTSDDVGLYAAVGPHATDTVSADLWRQANALAGERNLPLHFHVAQSADEYRRSLKRHQKSPIAWLKELGVLDGGPALLVHGLFAQQADLELLDGSKHRLGFCPSSQMIFGFVARTKLWEAQGISVVTATDCAASNDSWNLQKELRAYAGRGAWAASFDRSFDAFFGGQGTADDLEQVRVTQAEARDTERVLATVWDEPGGMHPKFGAGALEVGCLANLALWDLAHPAFFPAKDPLAALAFGDTTGALCGLMTAGKKVGAWGADWQSSLRERGRAAASRAQLRVDRLLAKA